MYTNNVLNVYLCFFVMVRVKVKCLEGSDRSTAWKEQLGAKHTIERSQCWSSCVEPLVRLRATSHVVSSLLCVLKIAILMLS